VHKLPRRVKTEVTQENAAKQALERIAAALNITWKGRRDA
jgi:hypothetical protein